MKKGLKRMGWIILIVLLTIILGVPLFNGAFSAKAYNLDDDVYDDENTLMSEEVFTLIKAGMKAASSHNMQPWKVQLVNENTFTIHLDPLKYLPVVDPSNAQSLMSIGGFIYNVEAQAIKQQMDINLTYVEDVNWNEAYPMVATVTILSSDEIDQDLLGGATYKESEVNEGVSFNAQIMLNTLEDDQEVHAVWVEGNALETLKETLHDAVVIESENEAATVELLDIFRFSRKDKNSYRYGLSLNTIKPPMQVYIESIIGLTSTWQSFGKSSITTFDQRAEKQFGYLLLSKENPSSMDYVHCGYLTQKISTSYEGVQARPAVQLIQPLAGMQVLNEMVSNNHQVQGELMMILGFQELDASAFHESIRHQVMDIVLD